MIEEKQKLIEAVNVGQSFELNESDKIYSAKGCDKLTITRIEKNDSDNPRDWRIIVRYASGEHDRFWIDSLFANGWQVSPPEKEDSNPFEKEVEIL